MNPEKTMMLTALLIVPLLVIIPITVNINNANAAGGLDFTTNKDTTATQTTRGIDWTSMCNTVQIALVQSCGTLVNLSDGTLTTSGETAFGCIRNGALILAAGTLLGQAGPTLGLLGSLAAPTGCGGIVKMDMLSSIGSPSTILGMLK